MNSREGLLKSWSRKDKGVVENRQQFRQRLGSKETAENTLIRASFEILKNCCSDITDKLFPFIQNII